MSFWETWQSYELADFLMFSPAIYFRLIEQYVAWSWPLAALYVLGLVGAFGFWIKAEDGRPMTIAIAMGWALPAYMFFAVRYANIMSVAPWFAALFTLQAGLLIYVVVRPPEDRMVPSRHGSGVGGVLVCIAFLYPLLAVFAGRGWGPLEPLGLMPDPIIAFTVGWFVLTGERRAILWFAPIGWTIVSSLTLYTMGEPDYWVLPLVAGVAATACFLLPYGNPLKN